MNGITPSQTIGPFAAPCLTPNEDGKTTYAWLQLVNGNLVTPDAVGERIRI
jgi:protocatechuate 3,4-dioxygenase, alpha subunit